MKKAKHAELNSKPKPRIRNKPGTRAPAVGQKKADQVLPGKQTRKTERVRFEGLIRDLNQSRGKLGKKIQRQTDELKIKTGQLRLGANRQQESDEQLHILTQAIAATADGIFILAAQKPDFPIIYTNPSFQAMTGYTEAEILGRNYFSLHGAKSDPQRVAEIRHVLQQNDYFHGEMPNSNKCGNPYWIQLRIAPVRDASGAVTHYVGIQTDVTVMRQRDLKIQEQREELLHVTRVGKLAEFVSSLAHEISQPLTAILSYVQAAQRMLAGREPQILEILQYIIDDDQRAGEVIRRLRSLLKKGEAEIKQLDLNALIQETIALITTDATVRNCTLVIDLQPDLPLIRGDPIKLQQVLLNLFSDSFDAMEDVPGIRDILVSTSRRDQNSILVRVKDTGCGIPAVNLPKLFSRFFTSKPDGLGMGLSISRSIIEAHGGRLEAGNNSDRGATFQFSLPSDKQGPA